MLELIQIAPRTYYINCPTRLGVYQTGEGEIWLIDSGSDKDTARKLVNKIFAEKGWTLKGVALTHSHADHMGGAADLKKRTGCLICAGGMEAPFVEYPILEPSLLYGGQPMKSMKSKFLMAPPCPVDGGFELLPQGLEPMALPGHSMGLTAFRTPDDVVFLGDSVLGPDTIAKYHISYIADVAGFLESLDKVDALSAKLFVPAHAEPVADQAPLVKANRDKSLELLSLLEELCSQGGRTAEELLKQVFDHYSMTLDMNQYLLSGSTIRSYLSYLCDNGRLEPVILENRVLFAPATA